MDDIEPEEFVAEENLNYKKMSVDEGVGDDNETIKTSNISLPSAEEPPSETICSGSLTFNPMPPHKDNEGTTLAAANDQVELMQWHYRLGHLPFSKLKQLTLNGEIPRMVLILAGSLFYSTVTFQKKLGF